jgi:hypothetical protein
MNDQRQVWNAETEEECMVLTRPARVGRVTRSIAREAAVVSMEIAALLAVTLTVVRCIGAAP